MNLEKANQLAEIQQTPALRLKYVSKVFGAVSALNDVSFEVMPGGRKRLWKKYAN